jgi:hypothetical protein
MRIISILTIVACVVTGCASAPRPVTWVRVDGRGFDGPTLQAQLAQCRAEGYAALAAAKQPALQYTDEPDRIVVAQNPYVVVPPPSSPGSYQAPQVRNPYVVGSPPSPGSYQAPLIDFSPIGRLPDDYARGRNQRRQWDTEDALLNSTIEACMARSGYIKS